MNLETFFEKFELFADAPDAVSELRKIILHLAVRGALVDQSNEDEPTKVALQRLSGRKLSLVDSGELPKTWESVALGELLILQKGKKPRSLNTDGVGLPYLDIAALERGELRQFTEDEKCPRATSRDLVIVCDGSRSGLVLDGVDGVLGSTVSKIIHVGFVRDYLKLFLRSLYDDLNGAKKGAAIPHLNIPRLLAIPAPLPPLAEQKRIVAKVDELMALCDRLEAQQQEREAQASQLARASLARFAEAPTPANLPFLFHSSFSIPPSDLRKSILTLAVQGKLVPQDPNDEPAEQELEVIQSKKTELITLNVIKKSDPSRPVNAGEVDHEIPHSWVWVRLVEICELITDGTHLTPKYTETGRMFLSAQNVKPFKFMPAKHRFVSEADYQGYVRNRKPVRGDILLTRVGAGIGEAATVDQDLDFAIYVSLGLVRPVRGFVFSDYITMWLNSPDGTEKSSRNTYGKGVSQGNLNLSLIRNFLVPLPPLAEQRRIVAKVEQLMALVDALETQLAASRATAANLLAAIVAELTGTPHNGKVSLPAGSRGRGRPPQS